MTFRRHILVLLVALFGLLAPSFAAGSSAVTAGTTQVVVTAACDDGVHMPEYRPCQKQGGKRVLPCHPDLGILVAGAEAPAWGLAGRSGLDADPIHRALVPAADPPPPRRG